MKNRTPRVNQLIRRELSQILLKEIDFPEGALVTITRVETSRDLHQSKVYLSVMPEQKAPAVLETTNKIIYFLQQKLNKRLKMRPIPRIRFIEEQKTKEAGRIEELLGEIKNPKCENV